MNTSSSLDTSALLLQLGALECSALVEARRSEEVSSQLRCSASLLQNFLPRAVSTAPAVPPSDNGRDGPRSSVSSATSDSSSDVSDLLCEITRLKSENASLRSCLLESTRDLESTIDMYESNNVAKGQLEAWLRKALLEIESLRRSGLGSPGHHPHSASVPLFPQPPPPGLPRVAEISTSANILDDSVQHASLSDFGRSLLRRGQRGLSPRNFPGAPLTAPPPPPPHSSPPDAAPCVYGDGDDSRHLSPSSPSWPTAGNHSFNEYGVKGSVVKLCIKELRRGGAKLDELRIGRVFAEAGDEDGEAVDDNDKNNNGDDDVRRYSEERQYRNYDEVDAADVQNDVGGRIRNIDLVEEVRTFVNAAVGMMQQKCNELNDLKTFVKFLEDNLISR